MTDQELLAAARKLEAAGRRWHEAAKHPGPYGKCNEQSCYHTHRMVSR